MYRLSMLIVLVLFALSQSWGQSQITTITNGTLFQGNAFSLDQWQWQINAGEYADRQAFIQITIFDQQGQVVFRIAGHSFMLGSRPVYSGSQLNREETQFIAPKYQSYLDRLHCLPRGRYLIESTLFLIAAPDNQPIAHHRQSWYQRQSCTLPIVMISPAQNSTLCASYPVFQWSAPHSAAGATYEFSLYKHAPQSEKEEAVAGQPLLRTEINTPAYQLAPTAAPLQEGRRYSWQILTREGGHIVARSPLRVFTYGCSGPARETSDPKIAGRPIYLMAGQKGRTPSYTLEKPSLNFSFVQRIPQDKYQLEITDEKGNTLALQNISTRSGHNYLSLPFSELGLPELENGRQLMVRLRSEGGDQAGFSVLIDMQ